MSREESLQKMLQTIEDLYRSGNREAALTVQYQLQSAFESCVEENISAQTRLDVARILIALDPETYFPVMRQSAHDLLTSDDERTLTDVDLVLLHEDFDMSVEWVCAQSREQNEELKRDSAMREGLELRALLAARRLLKHPEHLSPDVIYRAQGIICKASDDCEEVLGILDDVRDSGQPNDYLFITRRTLYNTVLPITERIFIANQLLNNDTDLSPGLRSGLLVAVIGFVCSSVPPAADEDETLGISLEDITQYVESLFAELAALPDEEQNQAIALAVLTRYYANLRDRDTAENRFAQLERLRSTVGNINFYTEEMHQSLRRSIDEIGFD